MIILLTYLLVGILVAGYYSSMERDDLDPLEAIIASIFWPWIILFHIGEWIGRKK